MFIVGNTNKSPLAIETLYVKYPLVIEMFIKRKAYSKMMQRTELKEIVVDQNKQREDKI